jgi:hypothetical protein
MEIETVFLRYPRLKQPWPTMVSVAKSLLRGLTELDQFVERTSRMLRLQPAEGREISSLQNWVEATGCLAREETAYLAYRSDLASLAPAVDNAVLQLETWVEDKLVQYWQGFRSVRMWQRGNLPMRSWLTSLEPIT